MLGYHFTSHANWLAIQKDGAIWPRHIDKPEIVHDLQLESGIWLFDDLPENRHELTGQVMFSACHHHSFQVVLLEVRHPSSWVALPPHIDDYDLKHTGNLVSQTHGKWPYHVNKPAHILRFHVPATDIRILAKWDLEGMINDVELLQKATVPYDHLQHSPRTELEPGEALASGRRRRFLVRR